MDPRIARTRRAALGAGRALALREGLDAVTHTRVARESGVGRRTLYRHWPTSQDLLRDSLADVEMPRGPDTGDVMADLVTHLRSLSTALDEGDLGQVLHVLAERASADPMFAELRDELHEMGLAPIRQLVEEGQGQHALPTHVDPELLCAMLEGPILHRHQMQRRPTPSDWPATVVALIQSLAATPNPPS